MVNSLKIPEFLLFKYSMSNNCLVSLPLRCCSSENGASWTVTKVNIVQLFLIPARPGIISCTSGRLRWSYFTVPNQSCIHFHSGVWRTVSLSIWCYMNKVWGWTCISLLGRSRNRNMFKTGHMWFPLLCQPLLVIPHRSSVFQQVG